MKFAIVTEDGVTVCQHFGRAPYYAVITAENGKIINKELREKAGHHGMGGHSCHEEHSCHDGQHGLDAESQNKHAGMLANILDCQTIIAGGMGYGAYQSMEAAGIKPFITDAATIAEAAELFVKGELINLVEKLH